MSLFEQLGGADGIRRVVDALTARLEADPELGALFAGVDGAALRHHRERYLAAVLGGPEGYTGRGLRDAHRPLAITEAEFDRFLALAAESAREVGCPAGAADELALFLRGLRPIIVRPAPIDGPY